MKIKLDLEWAFLAGLGEVEKLQQEGLQRQLKPVVSAWINKTYPGLLQNLKHDSFANNSTAMEIFSANVPGRASPAWLVVVLYANRTEKSNCLAVVGASREAAEIWAEGLQRAQQEQSNSFYRKVGKAYEDKSSFVLKNISRDEFHSLFLGPPTMVHLCEAEWLADVIARVLGVVIHDLYDNDWGYVVLGRDERKVFRAIDMNSSFPTHEEAGNELREKMIKHLATGAEIFPQGD
jgi:hypothetical protein